MKNRKIVLLLISFVLVSLYLIVKNSVNLDLCLKSDYSCRASFDMYQRLLSSSPYLLMVSLFTFALPNNIFKYWWKFARLAIPLVLVLVFIINLQLHHTPGGWMNLDNEIDQLKVGILYGLFVLGSLVQIFRGWRAYNGSKRQQ